MQCQRMEPLSSEPQRVAHPASNQHRLGVGTGWTALSTEVLMVVVFTAGEVCMVHTLCMGCAPCIDWLGAVDVWCAWSGYAELKPFGHWFGGAGGGSPPTKGKVEKSGKQVLGLCQTVKGCLLCVCGCGCVWVCVGVGVGVGVTGVCAPIDVGIHGTGTLWAAILPLPLQPCGTCTSVYV